MGCPVDPGCPGGEFERFVDELGRASRPQVSARGGPHHKLEALKHCKSLDIDQFSKNLGAVRA